jgi:hypothetical protein
MSSGCSFCERRRISVASADDHGDFLTGRANISARNQRRESGRASGLRGDPELFPQNPLRIADLLIRHQHGIAHGRKKNGKRHIADTLAPERVRGNAPRFDVDRHASLQCAIQCWTLLRFDSDDLYPPRKPRCDTANKAATANGNQHGVDVW